MDGGKDLLTRWDKDTLESWIGTEPKTFTLLYKITRDGCDPSIFHQKCDNQGPTVTVLYNRHGTVYGGYASQSWSKPAKNYDVYDAKAFLFQLKYNSTLSCKQLMVNDGNKVQALHYDSDYGPTFGYYALNTFESTIQASGGTFTLDGALNIDKKFYDFQELTKEKFNNDTKEVTELEVYKLTDEEPLKDLPWRETPSWNQQFLTELQETIVNYKPISAPSVPEARIVTVGPVGVGKSSFYNTVNSVFRERISHKAICGSTDNSLTFAFKQYQIRTPSNAPLNIRLCDTPGLEESRGIDTTEFSYILDGHLPHFYKFEPDTPLNFESLVKQPTLAQKVHCVAFVVDSTTLDVIPTGVWQKIKSFQKLAYKKEIPQVVLFTKIDKLCPHCKDDAGNVFKSVVVEKAVDKAAEMFRIPHRNVLLVKNYEGEGDLRNNINISALLALRQMLYFADDFLDYQSEHAAFEERGIQRLDIKE